jgi:hypothetical protein
MLSSMLRYEETFDAHARIADNRHLTPSFVPEQCIPTLAPPFLPTVKL